MTGIAQQEAEKKEIVRRYRLLLRSFKVKLEKDDRRKIRQALDLAVEAHSNMRRKSGEPYIYHPIAVAQICASEIGLGTTSIVCALLHDVVEDTEITSDMLRQQFGDKVASIVDGLTKISYSIFDSETGSVQAENFRKMLLTLSDDVRVILIKLADRLHNMRTLDSMSRSSQLKLASETLYIYAPLAHRLGLYNIKTELEDLSIKYTESDQYRFIASKLAQTKNERNKFIRNFIDPTRARLEAVGLKFEIIGRPKSIYSIMKKMAKQNIPFEEVYDLFAIRIIIDSDESEEKSDCFKAYGIITDMYAPNPDRFRDWISMPKANGYESLHTTVMSPEGKWVEVQIRTRRMNDIAEMGYAAHWKYKELQIEKAGRDSGNSNEPIQSGLDEWLSSVREMLEHPDANALDFLDDFKGNFFAEEIFVFTPKGELRKLPAGATALDFAYDIHSDVGNRCIGAKVNNKLVSLSNILHNGDQVEILTSVKQHPVEDWIGYVKTGKARQKIREYFKESKRKLTIDGREMLERKFRNSNVEFTTENLDKVVHHYNLPGVNELYILLGKGSIDKTEINIQEILQLANEKNKILSHIKEPVVKKRKKKLVPSDNIWIEDNDTELDYTLAACCNPIPGDDIFAFITVGEGIKIHRTNCPNGVDLMANYGYRILKARWAGGDVAKDNRFLASIKITGTDSVGIVRGITDVISQELQVNMKSINIDTVAGKFEGEIQLFIHDTSHLETLMENLKRVEGIYSVHRVK